MTYLGPEEFLLGAEFEVACADGNVYQDVVWKYCSDSVLRWFKTDGTQVREITGVSGGCLVVNRNLVHLAMESCQEER